MIHHHHLREMRKICAHAHYATKSVIYAHYALKGVLYAYCAMERVSRVKQHPALSLELGQWLSHPGALVNEGKTGLIRILRTSNVLVELKIR